MDHPQRAVFFLEEDSSVPAHSKPLMLEAVLFCPILRWMSDQLLADGVQRFFVVCGPRFAREARACLPEDLPVTVSEQQRDLLDFLDTEEETAVFVHAALPAAEAGPGFAYAASGHELAEVWREKMTNAVSGARLLPGWLPVFGPETLAELEPLFRERIVRRHIQNGVRILDPSAVYIDPRVRVGRGTALLPGTILRGESAIGCGCEIGPQAMVDGCQVGDGVTINASQVTGSTLADGCDVGPYAHVRPGCQVGPKCHVGAFVQLKNCVLGEGTKMSHLTYVGDADVGSGVNFGCGTVTVNYNGVSKFRTTVGDNAFIGCNTNLVAPVRVGDGAYTGAGSTITDDVPDGALAIARPRQLNKKDWVIKHRKK